MVVVLFQVVIFTALLSAVAAVPTFELAVSYQTLLNKIGFEILGRLILLLLY